MKCSICDQEIVFRSKDDSMVVNEKTDGRVTHGKCYDDKFGIDPLDDMRTASPSKGD